MIAYFQFVLMGMAIGIVAEIAANKLHFWRYKSPSMPLINIIFMFGCIEGSIAYFASTALIQFVIAATLGTLYEIANLKSLHWWVFPDNKMGPIKGIIPIFVVLAVAWGSVPIIITYVMGLINT